MRGNRFYLYFYIAFFFLLIPLSAQARRPRAYKLHGGPGMKFKVVGIVKAGEPVEIIEEKGGWVRLRRKNGKKGWILLKLYQKGWKNKERAGSHSLKIDLKFQNIPKPCVELFSKNLDELKRRLTPVGDDELELVVSIEPRLRSYRLFLIIDFNSKYYRHVMKRFAQPGTIDLLPYNDCIWAMYAYKQTVIRAVKDKGGPCAFVQGLSICLVLRKVNGEEVILQTVEDGVYIYFSPVLIMKRADGQTFKVMSEEPKKVGLLSTFTLPYPASSGTEKASMAHGVYRFFRSRP